MSTKRSRRPSNSTGLILILLALVALLGLMTGFLAHTLMSRGGASARVSPTSTALPHATTSQTTTPIPSSGATPTATAMHSAGGQFQLSVTVTPRAMTPRQQITITVQAYAPDTHAPVAGVVCSLRSPSDGSQGLYTTWPDSQTTDATGSVTWTLTAPNDPAGTYTVEAFGKKSSWSFKLDSTVQVKAAP